MFLAAPRADLEDVDERRSWQPPRPTSRVPFMLLGGDAASPSVSLSSGSSVVWG